MTTTTRLSDHETALAGGFDIVEAGHWVRPDGAEIRRQIPAQPLEPAWAKPVTAAPAIYWTRHPHPLAFGGTAKAHFYTMREAVEWIGPLEGHSNPEGDPTRNGAFR